MKVVEKAYKFAIKAHQGQVRKSEKDKPMIIHPINVANKLKEYGFDDNVIAAGYLHDVVEDTKYLESDILDQFGSDITSLVMGASEKDKSKSWEERKQETIDTVANLDLRHKAIVCCDKISNLEDMKNLFDKLGKKDFSNFNRGIEKQRWYYTNVYKSLINNEDENHSMFQTLRKLIDYIYFDQEENNICDLIFSDNMREVNTLKKLNAKNREVFKMNSIFKNSKPYVIELTGTPRTGKTTLINNLADFFKKSGFNVCIVEEFTTSKKYKTEVLPLLKNEYKKVVNFTIPKYVLSNLEDALKGNYDIIIIDRCLFDRLIWVDRLYLKKGLTDNEYTDYFSYYLPIIKDNIDIIIGTYADSITALKRDYKANLSLEVRRFLNINNLDEYNTSFNNCIKSTKKDLNIYKVNTNKYSERKVSFLVADKILDNMRCKYLKDIYNSLESIYK